MVKVTAPSGEIEMIIQEPKTQISSLRAEVKRRKRLSTLAGAEFIKHPRAAPNNSLQPTGIPLRGLPAAELRR